uniref:Gamma-glutamyltranspeptidase 1 n=1 Tax=Panagrellus redivivus TaxID=6233 RepID=A0A7E4VBZ7_PANRE
MDCRHAKGENGQFFGSERRLDYDRMDAPRQKVVPRILEEGYIVAASPRSSVHDRRGDNEFPRLIINVIVGVVVMLFALTVLAIYVLVPAVDPRPVLSTWGNRTTRYDWPPPSDSLLGKFRKAAITCDHGLCSEIGRDIMIKGGNAIDASIASLFCLGVTNPQSSGIGGGFIMTMYNRTTASCLVIDARETAPNAATRDMFHNDSAASKYGWRAIATPGEIAGYWLAFNNHGSGNVTWKDLVTPSVELARNGVPVSEYLANVLKVKEHQFLTTPSMKEWIDPSTGSVFEHGDIVKRATLAKTLEIIGDSEDPVELFYKGEFADIIVDEFAKHGAIITKADLEAYKPQVYETPLISDPFFEDLVMCGPPPPSSFAVAQSIVQLGTQEHCNHTYEDKPWDQVYNDPLYYHFFIETQKFAYAQRTLLGDAAFVPEAWDLAENMTTSNYTDWIYGRRRMVAQPTEYYGGDGSAHPEDHGTSHVSTIDALGNGVSVTSTVNRWFGASVQSPSLGIVWNDEMDDFSTPGLSNGFGFAPSESNFIEPGKRPMSSMSPMVIYHQDSGDLKMVIGASGGSKIISAVAKPIVRVLCFNETIKEAIDAPSLHNQFTPDITQYEPNIPAELIRDLEEHYGQKFKPSTGFEGITQGIVVDDDGFIWANGDYRRKTNMHPEGF